MKHLNVAPVPENVIGDVSFYINEGDQIMNPGQDGLAGDYDGSSYVSP